jgi:hypothetical protein
MPPSQRATSESIRSSRSTAAHATIRDAAPKRGAILDVESELDAARPVLVAQVAVPAHLAIDVRVLIGSDVLADPLEQRTAMQLRKQVLLRPSDGKRVLVEPFAFARDNMSGVEYSPEALPAEVKNALHALARSYGLRFAAVDMMVASTGWYFLEVNPNGQWAWLDLVGGASIYELFLNAFGDAS